MPSVALSDCVKPMLGRLISGTRVGGHHDDDVTEVRLAAVVVGERAVIHDLQQQVEHVRMRLLDFIEQQHAVRMLGDRLGQQAALIEADVARRRADQARHRMPLHVFRHVEAQELDAQRDGELPGRLRSCRRPWGRQNRKLPIGLRWSPQARSAPS